MKVTTETTQPRVQDFRDNNGKLTEMFFFLQMIDAVSVSGDTSKCQLGNVESIADARKRLLAIGRDLKLRPVVLPDNEKDKMKVLNEISAENQAIMAQQANIQSQDGVLAQGGSIALLGVRGTNNSMQMYVSEASSTMKMKVDRVKDVSQMNKPIN